MKRGSTSEFQITLIDNTSLAEQLARELRFLGYQLKEAWPNCKRDPIGSARIVITKGGLCLRRALAAPNSLAPITVALLIVMSARRLFCSATGFQKRTSGDITKMNSRK
jgi:hypothetical protein